MYGAVPGPDENEYLRLSLKGRSIKYSSFEELLLHERDKTLDALRNSIADRE